MNEDCKYKHVVKLPWIAVLIWTVILAFAFHAYPMKSIVNEIVRLFLFGVSWWFLFQSIDERASEYRRKILFKSPDLKSAFIRGKLAEWDAVDD